MWSVDSAATARLMIDFHRRLARGDSAPVALRRAEVAMMKDRRHSHPYYWAPFVVVGAPEHPGR
jgi:CHAT domain-containing protein